MSTTNRKTAMKELWDGSFANQVESSAYNTAAVESIVRTVSYYLRARHAAEDYSKLHFLEAGCGAGPNLAWLAEKGIRVSGVDISPTALELARRRLAAFGDQVDTLAESSVTELPFENESLDGVIESCVFQHLTAAERVTAFGEVQRVLKPGGLFCGYQLGIEHTTYLKNTDRELAEDRGTVFLSDSSNKSGFNLETIGLAHFFRREEYAELLKGFSVIDPLSSSYELPREEAERRGYDHYRQHMWIVHAVK